MFYAWIRLQITLADAKRLNGVTKDLVRYSLYSGYQRDNIIKFERFWQLGGY